MFYIEQIVATDPGGRILDTFEASNRTIESAMFLERTRSQ